MTVTVCGSTYLGCCKDSSCKEDYIKGCSLHPATHWRSDSTKFWVSFAGATVTNQLSENFPCFFILRCRLLANFYPTHLSYFSASSHCLYRLISLLSQNDCRIWAHLTCTYSWLSCFRTRINPRRLTCNDNCSSTLGYSFST